MPERSIIYVSCGTVTISTLIPYFSLKDLITGPSSSVSGFFHVANLTVVPRSFSNSASATAPPEVLLPSFFASLPEFLHPTDIPNISTAKPKDNILNILLFIIILLLK